MKKFALVVASLVALATAGLAAAWSSDAGKSVTAVSGTFTATNVSNSQTRSCTTTSGSTITVTKATYTGTASGSTDLTGNVTIQANSVIDTTNQIGEVDGQLKIAASGGNTSLHFTSVYDHGTLAGLATGHGATHGMQFTGNASAAFSASGGFTSGKLGGGTSGGSAVEVGAGHCAPTKTVSERSSANGLVSAVSSTSITVA